MTIAFLAPGQGSRDLAHVIEFVRGRASVDNALLEQAAAEIQLPQSRWLERGGRNLEATEILQPILTAISLVMADELIGYGIRPDFVAGHSLGEIAAWALAGCISHRDAVHLAALRGRLMAREAKRHPGGLIALGEKGDLEQALRAGAAVGWADFGAENSPDEIVLSGNESALRAILAVCPARRLPVSGPWHSSAMRDAVEEFRAALKNVTRHDAKCKLVLNRDGCLVHDEARVMDCLAEQLVRPVYWSKTLDTLHQASVREFVVLGPGSVLRSLVRKNLGPDVRVWNTDSDPSINALREALGRS